MHDILMLRNIMSAKCLGNVSWKIAQPYPHFSKEKISNSMQFVHSQHFRQIVTGKRFAPSRIGFPCGGFNMKPGVRCHKIKSCLVSYTLSVNCPVVLPYFTSLLLPSIWHLTAIRIQPCHPASLAVGEIPVQSPLLSARRRNPSFHKIWQKVL